MFRPAYQLETQLEIALLLARDYRFYVFPVRSRQSVNREGQRGAKAKTPFPGFDWKARSTNDPDQIRALWAEYPDAAVAIDCEKSGLLVIDADCKPGRANGVAAWRDLWEIEQICNGPVEPQPAVIRTPSGGEHWYFRQPAGMPPLGSSQNRLAAGIDTRGVGGYVVGAGAFTEAGEYRLEAGSLLGIPEAPAGFLEPLKPRERPKASRAALEPIKREEELLKLKSALPYIPAEDREIWRNVGMALKLELGDDGFQAWNEWSQRTRAGNYVFDQQEYQWSTFAEFGDGKRDDRDAMTLATVYHLAQKHGWPGLKGDSVLQAELQKLKAEAFKKAVVPVPEPGPNAPAVASIALAPMPGAGLETRSLAEIEPENLDWMWDKRLIRNKLNGIGGLPGLGKSQLLANIAATITTGGSWPDGGQCRKGGVLLIQAEDGAADTVKPRHMAAGADMNRIELAAFLKQEGRFVDLAKDLARVEGTLARSPWIDTIIIDPVAGFLGNAKSKEDTEIRSVLQLLSDFAERKKVTIIGVFHLNKNTNARSAADRIAGTTAFIQVMRMFHMVVADPDDDDLRVFQPFKHNIAKRADGWAFQIEGHTVKHGEKEILTSRIKWIEARNADLNEVLNGKPREEHVSRQDEAAEFLQGTLRHGPKAQQALEFEAVAQGINIPTLRLVKKKMGVISYKIEKAWWWRLPNQAASAPASAPSQVRRIESPKMHWAGRREAKSR